MSKEETDKLKADIKSDLLKADLWKNNNRGIKGQLHLESFEADEIIDVLFDKYEIKKRS